MKRFLAAALVGFGLVCSAFGDAYVWTGALNGMLDDTNNWLVSAEVPVELPENGDYLTFDYTVITLPTNGSVAATAADISDCNISGGDWSCDISLYAGSTISGGRFFGAVLLKGSPTESFAGGEFWGTVAADGGYIFDFTSSDPGTAVFWETIGSEGSPLPVDAVPYGTFYGGAYFSVYASVGGSGGGSPVLWFNASGEPGATTRYVLYPADTELTLGSGLGLGAGATLHLLPTAGSIVVEGGTYGGDVCLGWYPSYEYYSVFVNALDVRGGDFTGGTLWFSKYFRGELASALSSAAAVRIDEYDEDAQWKTREAWPVVDTVTTNATGINGSAILGMP